MVLLAPVHKNPHQRLASEQNDHHRHLSSFSGFNDSKIYMNGGTGHGHAVGGQRTTKRYSRSFNSSPEIRINNQDQLNFLPIGMAPEAHSRCAARQYRSNTVLPQ